MKSDEILDLTLPEEAKYEKKRWQNFSGYVKKVIVNTRGLNDSENQEAYQILKKEQTYTYCEEDKNQGQEGFWKKSWFDKMNAIQLESKHVRLSPQGLEEKVEKRKASIAQRRVHISIDYIEARQNVWNYIEFLKRVFPDATDAKAISAARELLGFLKSKGYIDKKFVNHPIAVEYVEAKRKNLSVDEIKARFFEQLAEDLTALNPEYAVIKKAVGDYLLRKALQGRRIVMDPDASVDAVNLIENSFEKIMQIIKVFGEVRVAERKRQGKENKVEMTKMLKQKTNKLDVSVEIAALESELSKYSDARPMLPRLSKRHDLVKRLLEQYEKAASWSNAGQLCVDSGRQFAKAYPWLAIKYYRKAITYLEMEKEHNALPVIADTIAELCYAQGWKFQAIEWMHYAIKRAKKEDVVAFSTKINRWENEFKQYKEKVDSDIDDQLTHFKENLAEALYDAFTVYLHPEDAQRNHALYNKILEMLIKLRGLLDQAMVRLTKSGFYPNVSITLWDSHYPCKNSEGKMREELVGNVQRQDPYHAYGQENHPLWNQERFAKLNEAIVKTQPFSGKKWLQILVNLSNFAKHVGLLPPNESLLREPRENHYKIENFYMVIHKSSEKKEEYFPLSTLTEAVSEIERLFDILFDYVNPPENRSTVSMHSRHRFFGANAVANPYFGNHNPAVSQELMLNILSHLADENDLSSCAQVSTAWCEVVEENDRFLKKA